MSLARIRNKLTHLFIHLLTQSRENNSGEMESQEISNKNEGCLQHSLLLHAPSSSRTRKNGGSDNVISNDALQTFTEL